MHYQGILIVFVLPMVIKSMNVARNLTKIEIWKIFAETVDHLERNITRNITVGKIWELLEVRIAEEVKKQRGNFQREKTDVWTEYQKKTVENQNKSFWATLSVGIFAGCLTFFQIGRAVMEFKRRREYELFDNKLKTKRDIINEVLAVVTFVGKSSVFDDVLRKRNEEAYMNKLLKDLKLLFNHDLKAENIKCGLTISQINELQRCIDETSQLFRSVSQGILSECFVEEQNPQRPNNAQNNRCHRHCCTVVLFFRKFLPKNINLVYWLPVEFQVVNLKRFIEDRFDFMINYYLEVHGTEKFSRSTLEQNDSAKTVLDFQDTQIKENPILHLKIFFAVFAKKYVENKENKDILQHYEVMLSDFELIASNDNTRGDSGLTQDNTGGDKGEPSNSSVESPLLLDEQK